VDQNIVAQTTYQKVVYDSPSAKKFGADQYGMKRYVMAFLKKGPKRNLSPEKAKKLQKAHLEYIFQMA